MSKVIAKSPNNSIDCLFTILKQIQADKAPNGQRMGDPHHYKKQRDMLALLGLEKSAPGPEKLGISYPGVPGLFRNRLADSIQLMQKTIWNNQIALKNKGNIVEEKGGMRKKWLQFALSSIG